MKTRKRTPRKVLSLLLCVLMVVGFMPYYAVQKKVEAVNADTSVSTSVNCNPANSKIEAGWRVDNVSPWSASNATSDIIGGSNFPINLGDMTYNYTSYYDFRSGAENKLMVFTFFDEYYIGNYCSVPDFSSGRGNACYDGFWHNYSYTAELLPDPVAYDASESTSATSSTAIKFNMSGYYPPSWPDSSYVYSHSEPVGDVYYRVHYRTQKYTSSINFQGNLTFNFTYYGINTTSLFDLYQQCVKQYGLENGSDIYTNASWQNYLSAMAAAKNMYEGKVTSDTITSNGLSLCVTQTTVCKYEENLRNAIANLERLNVELPVTLYSSGEGYGYSNRPEKVQYYSDLEFDVDLYEGYTKSVPTVTVNGKTYNGTKKDADTYHFVIPIETSVDKIVVNNVKKNTYLVSIQSSATGLTITGGGTKTVTHGGSVSFSVTKQTGYTQATPVVKVDGTAIAGTLSGDTYTYTISNVTANKTVTIDNQPINTYNVNYSLGAGVSKASGTATTVQHGSTATVKITVAPEYSQRTPAPKASNGTLTYVSKSGTTYTYTLSGVTDNTTVTVPGLALNQYTVTIPEGTGYSLDATSKTVTHGKTTSFTVTLDSAHNQNAPVAKIDGTALSYTNDGDKYTFTTGAITDFKTVKINWDGKDVFNGYVKHGETPVYKTPTRPSDENGKYVFIGWDAGGDKIIEKIEYVTAPVTATAVYNYDHKHDSDPANPNSVWELIKTDKATCTEDGMKYYVCKHCGEVTKNVVIPARGHKWTAEGEGWIIVKAPTCTETGLKSRYCCNEETAEYKACNHKEENVVVPATGAHHDDDNDGFCDDCHTEYNPSHGHDGCICHKDNVFSKVIRYLCTLLTKIFHKEIKCCKDMEWYGGNISSIS